MARRISVGFNWQGELDRNKAFEQVKAADQAGVDSVFVAEAWGRDAFSLLTQLAERTERIKLGTSIVNIYSRTPAALAQHFATLDELSGGRVIIGLGNSGPNVIEHFHGVKFQPAFTRMRETVEIIRAYFRHEPVHYQGELFNLDRGFTLRFEPVRKEVPIYLATLNPKSVKMTAEIADGWTPVMIPSHAAKEQYDQVQAWVRDAGRDPAAFTIKTPFGITVADTPEKVQRARQGQAATLAFYCARMGEFYYRQLGRQGYEDEANAVRRAWGEGGSQAAFAAVPGEMLDAFGFAGNVEQCIEKLELLGEQGANLFPVTVMEDDPDRLGKVYEQLTG